MIVGAKIATLFAWLLVLFNLVSPVAGYATWINYLGIFLLVAHCIETVVYLPAAKKAPGHLAGHVVQLLVFGYAHNMRLMELNK